MSMYVTFDEGDGDQVATNTGWGDLVRWVADLDPDDYPLLCQLADHGETTSASDLATEIEAAIEESPPDEVEGLASTLDGFLSILEANADADAVFVTDGTGMETDDEEEPATAEAEAGPD